MKPGRPANRGGCIRRFAAPQRRVKTRERMQGRAQVPIRARARQIAMSSAAGGPRGMGRPASERRGLHREEALTSPNVSTRQQAAGGAGPVPDPVRWLWSARLGWLVNVGDYTRAVSVVSGRFSLETCCDLVNPTPKPL
jgi:hypothetical protein